MKKIVLVVLLVILGIYVTGRVSLGERGAMRFVMDMDNLMSQGKADAVCDMLHDDLEITLVDHTTPDGSLDGGKDELCERTRLVTAALQLVPHEMNVQYENVQIRRDWRHPWTSEVFYLELRTFSVPGANVRIRTVTEDTLTLVRTLSGVKLRKLDADVALAR